MVFSCMMFICLKLCVLTLYLSPPPHSLYLHFVLLVVVKKESLEVTGKVIFMCPRGHGSSLGNSLW
uniref:Uncharacterized protein n=1 Tax=Solanum tuberosum TaxID=4113 RepID=M1AES9_SOLTU